MDGFTPLQSFLGGLLIGAGGALLLFTHGKVAGISGVLAGAIDPTQDDTLWRAVFLAGLVTAGLCIALFDPTLVAYTLPRSPASIAVAGLLVGFGTRLGNGCTSGHGVCGLSRLSGRSLAATAIFMTTGILTVALTRWLGGA
jgi:hypothetical protein